LKITKPDQVWCADIIYIGLPEGFAYLMAIMDWFSRYVLAWEVSNSMESAFCVSAMSGHSRGGGARRFTTPIRAASSLAPSGWVCWKAGASA
jgi:putative transposase